jgi:hypothetical protein
VETTAIRESMLETAARGRHEDPDAMCERPCESWAGRVVRGKLPSSERNEWNPLDSHNCRRAVCRRSISLAKREGLVRPRVLIAMGADEDVVHRAGPARFREFVFSTSLEC